MRDSDLILPYGKDILTLIFFSIAFAQRLRFRIPARRKRREQTYYSIMQQAFGFAAADKKMHSRSVFGTTKKL